MARPEWIPEPRVRWWDYVTYYGHPVRVAQWVTGTEWSERWAAWPHCCGQAGCWMHAWPTDRWCGCRCLWCRLARLLRR